MTTARTQEIRAGLAWLHATDPVLAQLIDVRISPHGRPALRRAIQARYRRGHLPDPAEVADLARRWKPYRSLASSLLLATARSS